MLSWISLVTVSAAIAQKPTPHPNPNDSAAIAVAAAEADTGRMVPGYQDISRYDTPGYCLAAIETIVEETWRSGQRALAVEGSPQDTLPTKALTIGKQCTTHLPGVQHIGPQELGNMERLAIVLDDSVTLNAAVNRHVSLALDDQARADILYNVINDLAYTDPPSAPHPRQFGWAKVILARLDSMGAGVRIQRLRAHMNMAALMTEARFDTTALLREDTAIRHIRTLLTAQDRERYKYLEMKPIVMDSLLVAWYRNDPDLKTHVRATLERELGIVHGLDPTIKEAVIVAREWLAAQIGTPARPIAGKYGFPSPRPPLVPEPGKVTLVTLVKKGEGLMTPDLAMLRRLYDKYHSAGLEIVLVLKTEGYSWASPPQSAAVEAKTIAWYYLNHLGLPFTIVVYETPFTRKPDGRRVSGVIPFSNDYHGMTLIGRDGRIRTMSVGLSGEKAITAYVEQALAAKGETGTAQK
jgi:hypothetical protein